MKTEQLTWSESKGWESSAATLPEAQLVLYFGAGDALADETWYPNLRVRYPRAHIVGCSTGGQIQQTEVCETGIVAVAMHFAATRLQIATEVVTTPAWSRNYGAALGHKLDASDLVGVFILSDGLNVNGSELVRGLLSTLARSVRISGGFAGDGARFAQTRVGAGGLPQPMLIAAIGFYGRSIRFTCGSDSGWSTFEAPRRVTCSRGRELFQLDRKPALDLYEKHLGEKAAGLPATALLYPLKIWDPTRPLHDVVRTVLAVNRRIRSMTFAGDIPQGSKAQLMRAEFNSLVAGATSAARQAAPGHPRGSPERSLALLVSGIGRRLVLGQRIEDEIQAVSSVLPVAITRVGFYSYGEIAPHRISRVCALHNQTMTITIVSETVT